MTISLNIKIISFIEKPYVFKCSIRKIVRSHISLFESETKQHLKNVQADLAVAVNNPFQSARSNRPLSINQHFLHSLDH